MITYFLKDGTRVTVPKPLTSNLGIPQLDNISVEGEADHNYLNTVPQSGFINDEPFDEIMVKFSDIVVRGVSEQVTISPPDIME